MRKFLIILLLPSFLTISKVVSTEKEVVYTSKEIYYLSQSDFGIYFKEKLSSPMVFGEVPVYANEDLVVELSLIHISEPTRPRFGSRMPSSA